MGILIVLLSMVMFLQCLNTSLITVPLPKIADELGISVSESSWLLVAYALGTCALLLQFAKYGRNNRLKFFFTYGLVLFILASLACAVADNFEILTIVRFLQGLGISMSAATCPIIVLHYVPEESKGSALGSMASGTGLAMILGPSIGGIIGSLLPWHYLMLINIPIAIFTLAGGLKILPADKEPKEGEDPDPIGSLCWFTAIAGATILLENLMVWDMMLIVTVTVITYLAVFLLWFTLTNNRTRQPIISPGMVRNRLFVLVAVSAMIGSMITEGSLYLIPYFMQISYGMDVLTCGAYFIVVAVVTFAAARFVGSYCDTHSSKGPVLASFACTLVFDAVFIAIEPSWAVPVLIFSVCLVGISFAVFETAQYLRMVRNTDRKFRDEAATMITVLTYVGSSFGLIAYSIVFNMAIPEASGADISELTATLMTEGFHASAALGLVLGIVGIAIAMLVPKKEEL